MAGNIDAPGVKAVRSVRPCVRCGAVERYPWGGCKPCARARGAAWRAANREARLKYNAEYRAAHREALLVYSAHWSTNIHHH